MPIYNLFKHHYISAVPSYVDQSPKTQRIDPAKFMLSQNPDRKMSTPAFPVSVKHPEQDALHLSRSPEVENIPEKVYNVQEEDYST